MTIPGATRRNIAAAGLLAALLCGPAAAQEDEAGEIWGRYEFWAAPTFWPALGDASLPQGEFDSVGITLGLGFHFAVRSFESSDLLLGFDLSVSGIDSDIGTEFSSVMARNLLFGFSSKWLFLESRNLSLDAGVGYYETDVADISTYFWGLETEVWNRSRGGAWLGVTWDIGAGRPGHDGGLFVAAKAHFVDFGGLRDRSGLQSPVLGPDAGRLDGPIYMLAVGYSGR